MLWRPKQDGRPTPFGAFFSVNCLPVDRCYLRRCVLAGLGQYLFWFTLKLAPHMQTQAIRELIAKAIAHEEATGQTARMLAEVAKAQSADATAAEVDTTVVFIRDYIEQVPDLLESVDAAAAAIGIADYLKPILDAAEQYFITPLDVIFDHLGLIGLADDAYFAQRLLQSVSDTYQRWTGSPLLAIDLTPANNLIRGLIGEPQASQLDQAVAETLQHGSLQKAFQGLKGLSANLPTTGPALGDANIDVLLKTPAEGWKVLQQQPAGRASGPATVDSEASIEIEGDPASAKRLEEDSLLAGYQVMLELYDEKVKAGELTAERQETLGPVLEQLEAVAGLSPDDTAEQVARGAKLRDLLGQVKIAIAKPFEREPLQAGTRAYRVNSLLQGMKRYLFIEAGRANRPERERATADELFVRSTRAGEAVRSAGSNDTATSALERSSLRQLAIDVRDYAQRHHLTLASPIWAMPPIDRDASAIFLSGGPRVWDAVVQASSRRGLKLLTGKSGRDHAQGRWELLRRSNLVVVDLTGEGGPDPAACYELGIALALGKAILPVASWSDEPPFDIDIVPIFLEGDDDAVARLGDAIDEATYRHQWGGAHSSVAETIAEAQRRFGSNAPKVKEIIKRLDAASDDAVLARELSLELLAESAETAFTLLCPAWPGSYAEPDTARCLHLVPPDLERSNQVVEIVSSTCHKAGWEHSSGGLVRETRIARYLWEEIGRASHLVFDLTGLDPKLLLELGMAHGLGRNTLLVGAGDTSERLFPSLAHLPFTSYDLADGAKALREAVRGFL